MRFGRLLARFGTPEAALNSPGSGFTGLDLPADSIEGLRNPPWAEVEQDLRWLEQPGNSLLCLNDPRYPTLLHEIATPPPVLFVRGDVQLLERPQLAVVGTRNPTTSGRRTAREFAAHLTEAGLVITSGLALGIDAEAHLGALQSGHTVAVMGTGLDRLYPARHRDLAHRIAEQGVLISELPPGTPPNAENFPRRNRVISGLSLGTLVVEAANQSGSLITARLAGEQGREVFAIPGSIHNPMARGCHALIRQGAKLVETSADILEELGALAATLGTATPPTATTPAASPEALDPEYRSLLITLGEQPMAIDTLVERSGLTAEAVSSMLLIMELQGYVASAGGLYTRLINEDT